jgi:uncharacterized protein YbjT (DUF2867 family)
MSAETRKVIFVIGATGRQGGGVSRALLKENWHVRAFTRNPSSPKAQALKALGAKLVQGDMENRPSLEAAFKGAYGVFSVQNSQTSGLEAEIRQGKLVAEVAKSAGIQHLVYGSAGIGKPTGIGSWDSKLQIEAAIKALGIPFTILRPMAFMELMTDKDFYPPVSTWHLMPKLMGEKRPVGWISTEDLGVIVAKVFASPERFAGQEIKLASDVKSIEEVRAIYQNVMGKAPSRFPMPVWMFKRFVGDDLITMWEWLRTNEIDLDTAPSHQIYPEVLSVAAWLERQKAIK